MAVALSYQESRHQVEQLVAKRFGPRTARKGRKPRKGVFPVLRQFPFAAFAFFRTCRHRARTFYQLDPATGHWRRL